MELFSVTGSAGAGKSSTLAVLLDAINREKYYHIITIEDPIEFLHNHKCSTDSSAGISQRHAEFRACVAFGNAASSKGDHGR